MMSFPASTVERARLALIAGMLFLLTLVPPTAARLFGPADRVHIGTYWYTSDFSVYLAAMREGMASPSWLVHNHMTAEPHAPAFIFPLYVGLGKAAGALGVPLLAAYGALETLGRIALLASAYAFASRFITVPSLRLLAFTLALGSGGLGVWVSLAQRLLGAGEGEVRPFNAGVEITPFGTLFSAPHLPLGLAATLLAIILAASAFEGSRTALAALAIDLLVLGLVHPFNLPVLLATCAAGAALRLARALVDADRSPEPAPDGGARTPDSAREASDPEGGAGARGRRAAHALARRLRASAWPVATALVAAAAGAPLVLYNALTFSRDPFWSATYGEQNLMRSPRPWELPLDCGVVFLLAPLGLVALSQQSRGAEPRDGTLAPAGDRARATELLLVFVGVVLVFIYLPVSFQRRFAVGLVPALATLAALGWPLLHQGALRLADRLGAGPATRRRVARRLIVYPLVILGFTATAFVYLGIVMSAATNAPIPFYFVDRDTYTLGTYLAARSGPDDVVLGAYETGNVLAGMLPGRVVLGNIGVTPRAREKGEAIRALYAGELTAEQARAFLRASGATFLIVGEQERKLGPHDPGASLGLPLVLRVGNALAYRVTEEPAPMATQPPP